MSSKINLQKPPTAQGGPGGECGWRGTGLCARKRPGSPAPAARALGRRDARVSGGTGLHVLGSGKHRPHFGHEILSYFALHGGDNCRGDLAIFFLRNSPGALLAGAPTLHGRDAGRVGRVPTCGLLARGCRLGPSFGLGPGPRAPLLLLLVGASARKVASDQDTADSGGAVSSVFPGPAGGVG